MKMTVVRYSMLIILFLAQANTFAQTGHSEKDAVIKTLDAYKKSLESLDVSGTGKLFTEKSMVIESGKVEGTYQDYLAHHIGPELGDFKSFKFENYVVDVTIMGTYAFAVETYNYTIILKKDNSEIKRKGVATSLLKKESGTWKIINMHNSSRKP
ncbi:MAG TPA: nuclear transport factor 2 family protein [Cyclobacteriaceae bacterium]|nr:nuclear transport factor 2 family protein [Cyclobacteriaceae bacterium]